MPDKIIVCDMTTKYEILKKLKGLYNYKFYSFNDIKRMLKGETLPEALPYLVLNYNYTYEFAKEISNLLLDIEIKDYKSEKLNALVKIKQELIQNGLYDINIAYYDYLKNQDFLIINPLLTQENVALIAELNQLGNVTIDNKKAQYKPSSVHRYQNREFEVIGVFNKIKELVLQGVSLNDIYLLNVDNEYLPFLKRVAYSYDFKINFEGTTSLISSSDIEYFLAEIETKNIDTILEEFKSKEIRKMVVDVINKFNLFKYDLKKLKKFFISVFKEKKYQPKVYSEAIKFGKINETYSDEAHLFIFNFNANVPKYRKDTSYLNDDDKEILGLTTMLESNLLNEAKTIEFLHTYEHIFLSYPLILGKELNVKSVLTESLDLIEKDEDYLFGISSIEDRLYLTRLLDDYLLYGNYHKALDTYDIKDLGYLTYDNRFKQFSREFICENPLAIPKLSYTAIKVYFMCPFYFYLERILNLRKYEETQGIKLGNYAHTLLENSYQENFDYQHLSQELRQALTPKEDFYASLFDEVIQEIKDFNTNFEETTALKEIRLEDVIEVEANGIKLYGKIDKMMCHKDGDNLYLAIIDYKTGGDEMSLANVEDGFNLQLPIYLYLCRHNEEFKNLNVVPLGFFLQKINRKYIGSTEKILENKEKSYRLSGYFTERLSDLVLLDPNMRDSKFIRGLKLTSSNELYKKAKSFNQHNLDDLEKIVGDLIGEVSVAYQNYNFPITPKKIAGTNVSCNHCPYSAICNRQDNDFKYLEKKPFKAREGEKDGLDA